MKKEIVKQRGRPKRTDKDNASVPNAERGTLPGTTLQHTLQMLGVVLLLVRQ